ncbi:hypothetical protein WR25_16675 [Diploscapter pachys]|uniref:Uncharacterized protein n=1 Tax=Diploscapter pachys TaxID=2018661 RepID=A0A2A2LTY2_9BILA|nr:hypothetical protein WR25_16675 [Diploscapter pachys]
MKNEEWCIENGSEEKKIGKKEWGRAVVRKEKARGRQRKQGLCLCLLTAAVSLPVPSYRSHPSITLLDRMKELVDKWM